MLKVQLIAYTPDPERTVAAAAKLCYSPVGIDDIREKLDEESTARFVDMLAEIGHESPIEHASFTFGIEGVSRSLLAQITRHRIASFSVQSQRYVRKNDFDFITPPAIAEDPEADALYRNAMEEIGKLYSELADRLKEKHIAHLIETGLGEKEAARKAEKMAIEDARYLLPNACDTRMVMTINARSLLNFFSHRCCNRAQWEIRALADEMLRLVTEVAPHLFKAAGPPCLRGGCPEGKMSCGEMTAVRAKYAAMKEGRHG